jgi:hypothetical protein
VEQARANHEAAISRTTLPRKRGKIL